MTRKHSYMQISWHEKSTNGSKYEKYKSVTFIRLLFSLKYLFNKFMNRCSMNSYQEILHGHDILFWWVNQTQNDLYNLNSVILSYYYKLPSIGLKKSYHAEQSI